MILSRGVGQSGSLSQKKRTAAVVWVQVVGHTQWNSLSIHWGYDFLLLYFNDTCTCFILKYLPTGKCKNVLFLYRSLFCLLFCLLFFLMGWWSRPVQKNRSLYQTKSHCCSDIYLHNLNMLLKNKTVVVIKI